MKKIKTDVYKMRTYHYHCDDCGEIFQVDEMAVRMKVPTGYAFFHKKCAKDLGSDLMLEIARI